MQPLKPFLILVAGGSASGKSTVVSKILEKAGLDDVLIIKHDDYYNNQDDMTMDERLKVNYDHPNSLDDKLLYKDLIELLKGNEISKPTYDFVNYTRSKETEIVKPKPVIIVEGILILTNKKIRDLADIKLFVESDDDVRFIRRLKRDLVERGRSLESIVSQYLETVKPMHYEFVKPTKRYADIIIPNDQTHDVAVDVITGKIKQISGEKK
ncbi:Uridine kinase [Alteracholeplasma palmae J233]|uniref:Uridine kinase n=1 Tax=Alteracholeplasma palmae (strain ATCC 49389 / J233) TaxID=1318466 RepID=U4KK28_ALTPJ|nr:uridine kinase [Alteracholeplasma palmae]CCV63858.1 Uridine kinase [Alteracholeplasma palmae J233]